MAVIVVPGTGKSYGLAPKRHALLDLPHGATDELLDGLRDLVYEWAADSSNHERMKVVGQAPGCLGFYGAVASHWSYDREGERRTVVWTQCEDRDRDEQALSDLVKKATGGLGSTVTFPGSVVMRTDYDDRARSTIWKPDTYANLVVHAPAEDRDRMGAAMKDPAIGTVVGREGKKATWSWRARGSFLPFAGADPKVGKPGKFERNYPYRVFFGFYSNLETDDAARAVLEAQSFELPMIALFDNNIYLAQVLHKMKRKKALA